MTRIWLPSLPVCVLLAQQACDPVDTQVGAEVASVPVYIEAEDGVLAGGFTIESDPMASGGKFIVPPDVLSANAPGNATATYAFRTTTPHDTYVVWGRIHGPGPFPDNSFWVSVDPDRVDAPPTQWRLSTGVVWWWGPITRETDYFTPIPYPLDAGLHHLVIRNSAPGVGLDRLFIESAPGHAPPGNDASCAAGPPNIILLASGCSPSCGYLLGTVCGAQACAGFVPLPSYDCAVCCRILDSGSPDDGGVEP
jgi:hypothetical protein